MAWYLMSLIVFYNASADAQPSKTPKSPVSNMHIFNALNAPSKKASTTQIIQQITTGATALQDGPMMSISEAMLAKNKFNMLYGVPTRVALDRYMLQQELEKRTSEILDLIIYWQSTSATKKKQVVKDYMWKKISKEEMERILSTPTHSDETVREITKALQEQINQFTEISNSLNNECRSVEFKSFKTDVSADIRFYNPVPGTSALGFMRANAAGVVNLSKIFSNISYNDIYKSPVSGSILIYSK